MDLPLLFEAGIMVPYMHKIIVVTCEEDLQLQRLMEQRHLSERDAKLMIGAQMNLDQKAQMAQFVIENSGSLLDTTDQVSSRLSNNMIMVTLDNILYTGVEDPHQPLAVIFPLEGPILGWSHFWWPSGSGGLCFQKGTDCLPTSLIKQCLFKC